MKLMQFSLGLLILMASVASAASSYKVTLPSDLSAGDMQLKAGEYTLTVEDKLVVFKKGKESIQIPFVMEKNGTKFPAIMLEISGTKLLAVGLTGKDMKVVFRPSH